MTAIALVLMGMHAMFGRAGLIVTDLALILLGNPLSAATSAPELRPAGWSAIGQWVAVGATVDLLRGISGFDGALTTPAVVALAGWAALGLSLLATDAARACGCCTEMSSVARLGG